MLTEDERQGITNNVEKMKVIAVKLQELVDLVNSTTLKDYGLDHMDTYYFIKDRVADARYRAEEYVQTDGYTKKDAL